MLHEGIRVLDAMFRLSRRFVNEKRNLDGAGQGVGTPSILSGKSYRTLGASGEINLCFCPQAETVVEIQNKGEVKGSIVIVFSRHSAPYVNSVGIEIGGVPVCFTRGLQQTFNPFIRIDFLPGTSPQARQQISLILDTAALAQQAGTQRILRIT